VNLDGILDYEELAKAPGLRAAVAKIKKLTKRPGEFPSESDVTSAKITAEEIDARIQEWKARGSGRIGVTCRVTRIGKPLANADVKFVPEDFLGPGLSTGTGTTDANGITKISQPSRGKDDSAIGMYAGFYRVEITKGNEIPAKFNKSTVLGVEVAGDSLSLDGGGPSFDLHY